MLESHDELMQRAKAIPRQDRMDVIQKFPEVELHKHLQKLFSRMQPDDTVEVTHGANERGKDLVIVRNDPITSDVIGVVVKSGDIRAKTAGDVDEVLGDVREALSARQKRHFDEIRSQIAQAFANPAELKALYERLMVHKVLVVIAGQISKPVRERLESEKPGAVEVKALDWLVDNFTNYYPELFFEGPTLNFLVRKIQELERAHSYQSKEGTLNLSEYFTAPFLAPVDVYTPNEAVTTSERIRSVLEQTKVDFSSLPREIAKSRRLILVGDPGVGKSGMLAKIALDSYRKVTEQLAEGRDLEGRRFPVIISAPRLAEVENVRELLEGFFGEDGSHLGSENISELFVDGLDEAGYEVREHVIDKAKGFASELDCALVITSRKIELLEAGYEDFTKLEVLPLEVSQAVSLLSKLLLDDRRALAALTDGLESLSVQYPLNPLTLRMLVSLVEEAKEVPASITELYEQFFDIALGRYDFEKGIEVLFDYQSKGMLLANLAFSLFFKEGRIEISRHEFLDFVETYGKEHIPEWGETQRIRILREIARSGTLRLSDDSVQFRHKTFADYLAARHINNFRDEIGDVLEVVTRAHFSQLWADVTFFYVGLLRRLPEPLLHRILEHTESEDEFHLAVRKAQVGRLLQAGWSSSSTIKRKGIALGIGYFPEVRTRFLKELEQAGQDIPVLFADFLLYWLAQFSFTSGALVADLRIVLEQYCKEDLQNVDLLIPLSLLFASKRHLPSEELDRFVSELLDELIRRKDEGVLERGTEIRTLVALSQLETPNKQLERSIRRKLARTTRGVPEIVKSLVPSRTRR